MLLPINKLRHVFGDENLEYGILTQGIDVASCKLEMTAPKIRLLFAVFCYFLFSKRQFQSVRAPRARQTTKLGVSHLDSYLGFCVCATNNTMDCKYVW